MTRHPVSRVPSRLFLTAAGVLTSLVLLTACTPPSETPTPTPDPASPTAAPIDSAPPAGPALVPDGSADDNLPLFAQVVNTVWAGPENEAGRAYIDALVAAGFDKGAMQVTEDRSTVGDRAESIQFSVQWGADCLVGQVGPATGDPYSVVVPALAEGGCLIGSTRPIDW